MLYRMLLAVPKTTPEPSLVWDLGGLKMKYRIQMKKLLFLHHLKSLDDKALAKQVFTIQNNQKLPGLVEECKDLIVKYRLPNVIKEEIDKNVWKRKVKQKIEEENSKELFQDMKRLKKLKNSELSSESFGRQPYLKQLNLAGVRTKFKFRTMMTQHVKMNYSSMPKYSEDLWKCDSCRTKIDTQSHVLWCPSYSNLREGKNLDSDKDLCEYLQEVFKIRHKLELLK